MSKLAGGLSRLRNSFRRKNEPDAPKVRRNASFTAHDASPTLIKVLSSAFSRTGRSSAPASPKTGRSQLPSAATWRPKSGESREATTSRRDRRSASSSAADPEVTYVRESLILGVHAVLLGGGHDDSQDGADCCHTSIKGRYGNDRTQEARYPFNSVVAHGGNSESVGSCSASTTFILNKGEKSNNAISGMTQKAYNKRGLPDHCEQNNDSAGLQAFAVDRTSSVNETTHCKSFGSFDEDSLLYADVSDLDLSLDDAIKAINEAGNGNHPEISLTAVAKSKAISLSTANPVSCLSKASPDGSCSDSSETEGDANSKGCLGLTCSRKGASSAGVFSAIPQSLQELSAPTSWRGHSEDVRCPVCQEPFTRPRLLPCLHTFCTPCILGLETYPVQALESGRVTTRREKRSSAGSEEGRKEDQEDGRDETLPSTARDSTASPTTSFRSHRSSDSSTREQGGTADESLRVILCPTCLREVPVSPSLEELPRNYVAERRVTAEALIRGGGEAVAHLECDSCAEPSAAWRVTVRCLDCGENLCSLCESAHRRQKRTRRHQLYDITLASSTLDGYHLGWRDKEGHTLGSSVCSDHPYSYPSPANKDDGSHDPRFTRLPPPRQIPCNRHQYEALKLFCLTCNVAVCRDCVVMDHRDHDCQFLCPQLFREQMGAMQRLIHCVVPRVADVDLQLRHIATAQASIRSRADDVTREIHAHMDAYMAAIRQHRDALLEQVATMTEEQLHALHASERQLRQVRSDVEHTCRFVSDMIENASDVEILSVKRLVTERLTGLKSDTGTRPPTVTGSIRFSPFDKGEIIHSFQMYGRVLSRISSAANSVLLTEGLSTSRVASESSVVLQVNGEDNSQYICTDVQIKAWLVFQTKNIFRTLPVAISNQKDGRFCLRFTPLEQGTHFLHVAVDGQPVKDSPVRFRVKAPWRGHQGVWHCCTLCSAGGRLDVPCACRAAVPGQQVQRAGCCHADPDHPGGQHWSCCGKMTRGSECPGPPPPPRATLRQVTL